MPARPRRRSPAARAGRAPAARGHPGRARSPPARRCRPRGRSRPTLGVSRGVITEAYGQLASEGYLAMRQGAPVRVAAAVQQRSAREPARSLLPTFAYDLRPGVPDLAGFPADAWLRSLRAAWRAAPFAALGEPDPRGLPAAARDARRPARARARRGRRPRAPDRLRRLPRRLRGAVPLPRAHGRRRASRSRTRAGIRARLAIEQAGLDGRPGRRSTRTASASTRSATSASCSSRPATSSRPARVLSRERRAALVEWAADTDGADRRGRLRLRARPSSGPARVQGLAPERVVLIGSASKRLAPGLRLGWMLTPSWLTWPLTTTRAIEAAGGDVIAQLALHRLPRARRARAPPAPDARAATRRAARRCSTRSPGGSRSCGRATAPPAGLFVLAEGELDEARVVERAAAAGVGVEPLGLHRFEPGGSRGLVLGYGALAEPALERAVALWPVRRTTIRRSLRVPCAPLNVCPPRGCAARRSARVTSTPPRRSSPTRASARPSGGVQSREVLLANLTMVEREWARDGFSYWMFFDRETGEPVARGGLRRTTFDGQPEVEVGWTTAPDRWGEGFATELGNLSVRRRIRTAGARRDRRVHAPGQRCDRGGSWKSSASRTRRPRRTSTSAITSFIDSRVNRQTDGNSRGGESGSGESRMAVTAAPVTPSQRTAGPRRHGVPRSSAYGPSTASARSAVTPTGRPSCSVTSSTATSTPRSTATATTWTPSRSSRSPHQRGTAYVRLVCAVSIRPARLSPTLAARTLRGVLDELMLAPARARATCARLIDVAVVPAI